MAKNREHKYAMSRRRRAILIGVGLVATALLVALDRGGSARQWTKASVPRRLAPRENVARYDGRSFTVVKILDGDTLEIDAPDAGAPTTRVRLLGIDAPEMGYADESAMYYARQATDRARQLAGGAEVTLYLQTEGPYRGKYGRLLAYVVLPDGRFLNEALVSAGCAYADLRFHHGYYQKYRQLEASARSLGMGLWHRADRDDLPAWLQRMDPDLLAPDKE